MITSIKEVLKKKTKESPTEEVITVENLTKKYDDRVVLNDVSFSLKRGEILGVLGSNGAGKTTLLETIEGLRTLDQGKVSVLGYNQKTQSKEIQNKLGIQLQKTSLFDNLSVYENLKLYSNLYGKKHNIDELLEDVGLIEHKKKLLKKLSGGQFQKLKLCLSLLNIPEILFLDEPSTGLDPAARSTIWRRIKQLKEDGCSIILTTHYMEEAHELCDRVMILHGGTFVANDTPSNLIEKLGYPKKIILKLEEETDTSFWNGYNYKEIGDEVFISTSDYSQDLSSILHKVNKHNKTLSNIGIQEANLEDVFLELTEQQIITESE